MMWTTLKDVGELVGALGVLGMGAWWLSGRLATIETKIDNVINNHLAHIYKDIDEIHQWMLGQREGK